MTASSIDIIYYSLTAIYYREYNRQDDQLSQRDRAAVCISFGQKWKTGTGRQYLTDISGGITLLML